MSERLEGIPEGVVPAPRDSAVAIVARQDPFGTWHLLMGLRARTSRFFPGNWAFPGGGVEADDRPAEPGARARCAARELAEEAGIEIPAERFESIGFKTTPPFHPVRYRTEFFVTLAPAGLEAPLASPSPQENEEFRFLPAHEALEEWEDGKVFFPPPLPPLLRVFSRERGSRLADVMRILAIVSDYDERVPRIEFAPRIWMYPMASATLAPATHTNVWLPGERRLAILDPGGGEGYDVEHLALVVERRQRIGAAPLAILLTHHHQDHIAGAAALARRFRLPVRAHPETARILNARCFPVPVIGDLEDGTAIDLGGITLVALHTPGHAPGHLAFHIPERDLVLVGDLLSGFSSVFIPPDDGDMGQYLTALQRIADLGPRLLLPAHGPPLPAAAALQAIAHRRARGERILAALAAFEDGAGETVPPSATGATAADLVPGAYADTADAHPLLAALQVRAHLLQFEREGRVERCGTPGVRAIGAAGPGAAIAGASSHHHATPPDDERWRIVPTAAPGVAGSSAAGG